MPDRTPTLRRIGWGATTFAVAAAITALSAPTAFATVGPVDVEDAGGSGTPDSTPVAGQLYRVTADADINLITSGTVTFYDNGQCIASAPEPSTFGHTGIRNFSFVYWVPTAGTHTLTATQNGRTATTTVTVTAAPAGSTPAQQPKQPGCGGGGSLDLGSVNLLPGSSGI